MKVCAVHYLFHLQAYDRQPSDWLLRVYFVFIGQLALSLALGKDLQAPLPASVDESLVLAAPGELASV